MKIFIVIYSIIFVILLGLSMAYFASGMTVDIFVKSDAKTRIKTEAAFAQNEVVDLTAFTDNEIIGSKQGLGFTKEEETVRTKVLQNKQLNGGDIAPFIAVLNKQIRGERFTSDEIKYLISRNPLDIMKYLTKRKLKEL